MKFLSLEIFNILFIANSIIIIIKLITIKFIPFLNQNYYLFLF